MRGDRNIWRVKASDRQILCLHTSSKVKTNEKSPWIGKYSVVKVQIACEPARDFVCASGSQQRFSGDERAFQVEAGFGADMLHPFAPIIAQVIIANAVLLSIHEPGQGIL